MAILTPFRPEPVVVARTADGERLSAALQPWRNRLWLRQLLRWSVNGAIAGIVLACILLLISRFIPWPNVHYWAIGVAVVILLSAFGAALWRRPSLAHIARQVDAQLALHDRLSTAWELRNDPASLPALQRRDALEQLNKHAPTTAIALWPRPFRLFAIGAALIALVLLLMLPNPMDAVLQQQAAFQSRLASQIAAIDHIRSVIDSQTDISAQERARLDKLLRQLMSQLAQAKNEAEAQQILAQGQAQLQKLRDPQATNKAQATASSGSSLENSSNTNLSNAGKSLATGDAKGLNDALQKLASQVNNMTPAQREQLAQQIERAANQASGDPQLSSALHQLAKSIADGSSSEISDAIKAVESAAAQNFASQANANSIDQASQALQQIANALASSTDSSTGQNSGQSQTQNSSQNTGQGQSPGQGQGSNGSGNQGNSGNKSGKNEQVYIPGQVGSGSSTVGGNGDNGTVQPGKPVSYQQVIAQYQQMASDSIDNSNLPPDLKDLIRNYYNSLEGQQ